MARRVGTTIQIVGWSPVLVAIVAVAVVASFLVVHARGRVLLGTLSPAPPTAFARSSPVLEVFQEAVREIEVIREPLDMFFPVVGHRYDRLLASPLDREEADPA